MKKVFCVLFFVTFSLAAQPVVWDANELYSVGDLVVKENSSYLAIQRNINVHTSQYELLAGCPDSSNMQLLVWKFQVSLCLLQFRFHHHQGSPINSVLTFGIPLILCIQVGKKLHGLVHILSHLKFGYITSILDGFIQVLVMKNQIGYTVQI